MVIWLIILHVANVVIQHMYISLHIVFFTKRNWKIAQFLFTCLINTLEKVGNDFEVLLKIIIRPVAQT